MVTIYDIAKEMKISPSTVSRALSGSPLVSEKTRARVKEQAKKMGYQVNMVARQLRNQNSNIIALVSLQENWSWFTDELANGVEEEIHKAGYEMVVLHGAHDNREIIAICENMRFAGIIVASTELGQGHGYTNDVVPVVYVNRIVKDCYSILPNDRDGVRQAMEYLRKNGHKKIGFINGPDRSMHSGLRYEAFADLMREYQFDLNQDWILSCDWTVGEGYEAARRLLAQRELPTAILAFNDQMCIGIYRAIYEKGFQVGREISVVGIDNAEFSKWMVPALTTVSFPIHEMGREAALKLIDRIQGKECEKETIVEGRLFVRGSVGKTE